MKIAIIGRTEWLYDTATLLLEKGYEIPLIVTAKEAPEYKRTARDFEELANKIGATFINTAKINLPENIEKIKRLGTIDLAISINYAGIIAQEVIDLFPVGILNAHGGDLPRYRGNACQAWAIINGETQVGLCIHKMIGGELDSGNIIVRKYLQIDHNTRVQQCLEWMETNIPQMMLEATEKLAMNPAYCVAVQSTNPKDALRCYPRNPDDGRIDWNKSNIEILRLINASSEPYAGAFCEYEQEKMLIWRAELYEDDEIYLATVGQIAEIQATTGYVVVITGKGKLLIKEVEYQQTRTQPKHFIKSIRKRLK
jgi:methionyl-tRNA formyltransferase